MVTYQAGIAKKNMYIFIFIYIFYLVFIFFRIFYVCNTSQTKFNVSIMHTTLKQCTINYIFKNSSKRMFKIKEWSHYYLKNISRPGESGTYFLTYEFILEHKICIIHMQLCSREQFLIITHFLPLLFHEMFTPNKFFLIK